MYILQPHNEICSLSHGKTVKELFDFKVGVPTSFFFDDKELSIACCVLCLVTQSCPTLCGPGDCSPPGSSVYGDSPGKNTRVGCHFLLQGIFLTQELNPCLLCLLHCRQILYWLSHQRSPKSLVFEHRTLRNRNSQTVKVFSNKKIQGFEPIC